MFYSSNEGVNWVSDMGVIGKGGERRRHLGMSSMDTQIVYLWVLRAVRESEHSRISEGHTRGDSRYMCRESKGC